MTTKRGTTVQTVRYFRDAPFASSLPTARRGSLL
jgi:hypothetical protein